MNGVVADLTEAEHAFNRRRIAPELGDDYLTHALAAASSKVFRFERKDVTYVLLALQALTLSSIAQPE
jgi:hypothetical protein